MRTSSLLLSTLLLTAVAAQDPVLSLKLTDAHPVQMPELHAYALLASATIDAPETISSVIFNVDGTDIPAQQENGAWLAWWTPDDFGTHTVTATANGSNGSSAVQMVDVEVTSAIADQTVITLDDAVIDWGGTGSQWFNGTYTLPQSVGAYDQITAHLNVSCPNVTGGCDDWDRLAWIEAKAPSGEWVEIIRYITPYGVPCNHSIDVTDFASLLQGNIPMRMYIDTWGTGGWKMDLSFSYHAGVPTYLYSTVQTVWHGNYPFGNPANLQPVPVVPVDPGMGATSASLRLVTSGHGWGGNNTGNAAEFYHATHNILVNGTSTFTQDLWTDCNPNPDGCSPQNGTWQYDRAGWCPGSISRPYIYDLTSLIGAAPFDLTYRFQQNYTDLCHPNNPSCVSGQTCANCNDGYNPFYQVSAYVIGHSNAPISLGIGAPRTEGTANAVSVSPNPSDGRVQLRLEKDMGECVVTFHDVSGATRKTWFFGSKEQVNAHRFDLSGLAKGTYFVKVQGHATVVAKTLVVQ